MTSEVTGPGSVYLVTTLQLNGKTVRCQSREIREIFITISGQEGPGARCEQCRVLGNGPLENEARGSRLLC